MAVVTFEAVVNLELMRREGDRRVGLMLVQASDMMDMLLQLVNQYQTQTLSLISLVDLKRLKTLALHDETRGKCHEEPSRKISSIVEMPSMDTGSPNFSVGFLSDHYVPHIEPHYHQTAHSFSFRSRAIGCSSSQGTGTL